MQRINFQVDVTPMQDSTIGYGMSYRIGKDEKAKGHLGKKTWLYELNEP